jgi:hypothetical protein
VSGKVGVIDTRCMKQLLRATVTSTERAANSRGGIHYKECTMADLDLSMYLLPKKRLYKHIDITLENAWMN